MIWAFKHDLADHTQIRFNSCRAELAVGASDVS